MLIYMNVSKPASTVPYIFLGMDVCFLRWSYLHICPMRFSPDAAIYQINIQHMLIAFRAKVLKIHCSHFYLAEDYKVRQQIKKLVSEVNQTVRVRNLLNSFIK